MQFSIGDRVIERPQHGRHIVARASSPAYQQVCRYLNQTRSGEVTGLEERRIKSGARCLYVEVRWDGFRSSSWHARNRLKKVTSSPANTLNQN